MFNFILVVLVSIIFTELVGYFLHQLLHSERISWLSKSHMIHHLKDYGPRDSMRRDEYLSGARKRTSVVGIGLEWVVPSAVIYSIMIGFMFLIGVSWWLQLIAVATSIFWAYLMFNYLHDAMHLTNFWMLRVPLLSSWFKKARRRHDIHHKNLSDEGRMNRNFGICFFVMDRLFGTLEKEVKPFNFVGYEQAKVRYSKVIGE